MRKLLNSSLLLMLLGGATVAGAQPVLLPQPQQARWTAGHCTLDPQRHIWIAPPVDDTRYRIARAAQNALAEAGVVCPLWAGGAGQDAGAMLTIRIDPARYGRAQGYRLRVRPRGIELTAADAAGAFYGVQTLRQLARQSDDFGRLACVDIDDWPDFCHRGVMLDVSRDKVPTLATLKRLISGFAELKYNQVQLYLEHTFAYRGHEVVWADAAPLTGEDILALDAFCRDHFIELVPNQNSFGHMERWLKHDPYRHLTEDPNVPRTLNPVDPGSIALVADLFDQLLGHFTSAQFNVGCDEAALGRGLSRAACAERGVGRVYLDYLLQVHALVEQHGRTMQFWADIILNHPELIDELPRAVVALIWGYEAAHPFAEQCQALRTAGVPFYVCPGTSAWLSIIGRTINMRGNVRKAAVNGRAHGAVGLLMTDWGDFGHWQHLPISYPGYAWAAAQAWAVDANAELDLARALDVHVLRVAAGVMGQLLLDLGNIYMVAESTAFNGTAGAYFMRHLDMPLSSRRFTGVSRASLQAAVTAIDEALPRLRQVRLQRDDADQIVAEVRNNALLARHGYLVGRARFAADGATVAELPVDVRRALAHDLAPLVPEFGRLWRQRNRPGGLSDSLGRFEALLDIYRAP